MTGKIFEIKRFAVHDGDGIRTTVFLKGCPLRCVWCHNPEGLVRETEEGFYAHKCIGCGACKKENFTAADCPGEARVVFGRKVTVEELLPLLLEDKDFYASSGGGVTISGGECLVQADFCAALLKELKENGIHTAVDTCGFVSRSAFEKVMPYTDIFLYDLKAYDRETHIRCTGQPNDIILDNLRHLAACRKDVEIRIPYVPDYNAGEIPQMAEFLATLDNIAALRLLPYHNFAGSKYEALGIMNTLPTRLPTEEELKEAKAILEKISGIRVRN